MEREGELPDPLLPPAATSSILFPTIPGTLCHSEDRRTRAHKVFTLSGPNGKWSPDPRLGLGFDFRPELGPQDDAIQLHGGNVTFLVRARVDLFDTASDPATYPAESGSKVHWSLDSGLATYDPPLSHVINGEAFTTITMPATSGRKARLTGKVTRLMVGGEEIAWGPPAAGGAAFDHADYEKPSPEVRFYEQEIALTCGEGAESVQFSLNDIL